MPNTWCKRSTNGRRTGERISFHYLISQKYTGDQVRLDVLREGQTAELDVRLASPDALVPLHLGGLGPSFLIVAGAPAVHAHPPRSAFPHCTSSVSCPACTERVGRPLHL